MEKVLLIPEDEIYTEEVRTMTHVYSPKTRKLLGKVYSTDFKNNCVIFKNKYQTYGR